jgi:hypothetical protein
MLRPNQTARLECLKVALTVPKAHDRRPVLVIAEEFSQFVLEGKQPNAEPAEGSAG